MDINKSQAPRSDDTAPGFRGWYDVGTGSQATHVFTNYTVVLDPDTGLPTATNVSSIISCTLAQTVPSPGSGSSLKTDWLNKNGNTTSTDPNAGYRLSGDGVWVYNTSTGQPYTNGGALSLTISNLSAGVHTITTYHNDLWGNYSTGQPWINQTNPYLSRCIISVNGTPVFTNVPSFFATNDGECGFAFFTVTNDYDGQPVVINFDPDHSRPQDLVVLNGFEIDRPYAPGTTATALFPSPGDEHVFANNDVPLPGTTNSGFLALQWLPAGFAISNYIYFGTSSNAVYAATMASSEFKSSSAASVAVTNTFAVTNLNSALTYYWRVDQLDVSNGSTNLTKGYVWKFRTRHLAFPTAEGYGRFARGGRGGVVMEVTNLLDYDTTIGESVIPGSYRWAIESTGPRTVVFRVSGLVRLKRPCVINAANGYLTVAGQTAPGEGICLANWRAGMSSCSDVIMRFIRCRLGDASQQAMDGIGLGNSTHSIIDHCSISWTMDEASSSRQSGGVGSQSAMITFQHNIISEALDHSYHYNDTERANTGCTNCYQPHAFAASISGEIGSYHHNLIAHCTQRNWSLAGGLDQSSHYAGSLDIRNNVVFNWTDKTTDGGVARCNYVSNYYKPYPSNPYKTWLLQLDGIITNYGTESYYVAGNVMEGQNYYTNNWQIGTAISTKYNDATTLNSLQTNQEIFPSYVTTQTASNAFKYVLSDVGANQPVPDVIDQRIIEEVRDGTTHYEGTNGPTYTINGVVQDDPSPNYPGIIDSQTDVHDAVGSPNYPWPAYATYNVPVDSDHDGLPDWWEILHGTNPNSPPGDFSDANADPDGDGYSNLEVYLNWLAKPHFQCPYNGSVDVDLSTLNRGFSLTTPTNVVFEPTNGTVVLLGDGKTARFTPTADFYGMASFKFTVIDAQGDTMTNSVGLYVINQEAPNITHQPTNQTGICDGSPAVFSVTATGSGTLCYQWQKNGTNLVDNEAISGSTSNILTLSTTTTNDAGNYWVIVSNALVSVTSSNATLTVNPLPDATITGPPSVCANSTGNTASVTNAGVGAHYGWSISNGTITAGSGTRSITFRAGSSGSVMLSCWVTNASGCVSGGSQNKNVLLNPVPDCAITVNASPLCPNTGGYTASVADAGDGAQYAWTINNGTIDSGQGTNAIAFTAGTNGMLTLCVAVTNAAGCWCTSCTNLPVATNAAIINATFPRSVTNSAGGSASFWVIAGGTGLTYQWQRDGTNVVSDPSHPGRITGMTTLTLTISPVGTNDAAGVGHGYSCVVSTSCGNSVTSLVATLTVLANASLPAVAITNAASGIKLTNAPVIKGTAKAGFTGGQVVWVQYAYLSPTNGGSWTAWADATVSSAGSLSNWVTAGLTGLQPGGIKVAVKAQNSAGNVKVVTNTYYYVVLLPLTVVTNGNGSATPNLNGSNLYVGQSYTLSAVPVQNWLFTNWTSSVNGGPTNVAWSAARYTFVMQSNLTLIANFATNQFLSAAGDYYGLFYDSESGIVSHQTAGFIKITVKAGTNALSQTYSGYLYVEGERVPFAGKFDPDLSGSGHLQNPAVRTRNGTVIDRFDVEVNLDLARGKVITGTVSNLTSHWGSTFEANRAMYKGSSLAPMASRYTIVLPPEGSGAPGGYGFVCLNVLSDGTVLPPGYGRLGDGYWPEVITAMVSDQSGKTPFYAKAYKKPDGSYGGSVWGWLYFANGGVGGELSVNKVAGVPASVWPTYLGGYTNLGVVIQGSGFTNTTPLLNFSGSSGKITFEGGILSSPVGTNFTLSRSSGVTFATGHNPNAIQLNLSPMVPAGGNIFGQFRVPAGTQVFRGAILQNQNKAYGLFTIYPVTDTPSGSVTVEQGP